MKKVGIIGVGLMGGSLAMALKSRFRRLTICGYARSEKSLGRIKRLKIVDKVSRRLEDVVGESDIIVIALPIYASIEYLKKISPFLKRGAIVMDLGSTKELISRQAKRYLPQGIAFVGCHPLCGSEKAGAQHATRTLYRQAQCIITASRRDRATKVVAKLWQDVGARVSYLSARAHDELVSYFSHLPHILSFALTNTAPAQHKKFVPPSFKDLTRISHSPSHLWTDIFLSNRDNIIRDLDRFITALKGFRRLMRGNRRDLARFIDRTNRMTTLRP